MEAIFDIDITRGIACILHVRERAMSRLIRATRMSATTTKWCPTVLLIQISQRYRERENGLGCLIEHARFASPRALNDWEHSCVPFFCPAASHVFQGGEESLILLCDNEVASEGRCFDGKRSGIPWSRASQKVA